MPDGTYVLDAGMGVTNTIIGPQNSFKTAILMMFHMTILERYLGTGLLFFDSEESFKYSRLNRAKKRFARLSKEIFDEDHTDLIQVTHQYQMMGDDYFEATKRLAKERQKLRDNKKKTMPFPGKNGEFIKEVPRLFVFFDSMSETKTKSVEDSVVDKNNVGQGSSQTVYMKDGNAKTQMVRQMGYLASVGHMAYSMTGHVGKTIQIEKYEPVAPALSYSKRGISPKGLPGKTEYLNNNYWEIFDAKPLVNSSSDKSAKYPKYDADRDKDTVDLMVVSTVQTRNKNGVSGFRYEFIVSQSEGLLPSLTEFHYVKALRGNYGVGGNDQNFFMELYPHQNLKRTTIRQLLDDDPKLCQAVKLTADLAQIQQLWRMEERYVVTPAELYQSMIDKGYDWDILLDTREWWTYMEDEKDLLPRMTIMDLLAVHAGELKLPWYDKEVKRRQKAAA